MEIEKPIWVGRPSLLLIWPTIRGLVITVGSVYGIRTALPHWEWLAPILEGLRPYWNAVGWEWWIGVPLAWTVWRGLELACTRYELTSTYLRISTGVLSRWTDQQELYRLKKVSLWEPWWLRPFGRAWLVIDGADPSVRTVRLEGVARPVWLREQLSQGIEDARARHRVTVGEWI